MDISALREQRCAEPYSVGALNQHIRSLLAADRVLSAVSVRGEISNFVAHRSGHLYFTLKDEESQLRAVMFRSAAATLRFLPTNGMRVTVRGRVEVYQRDGTYQIYVASMQPDGLGALWLAYEQLKGRLEQEGLFDPAHKQPLPRYPRRIGVVTSPVGAAIRDILHVTARRFPLAAVYLYPALVQGEGAEASLCRALDYLDRSGLVDVIIIGRGGGSLEDLFAFNGESLARRIYACHTPVISAVGHETDFTICDFVADLRAPTPSAAAELAVPDQQELLLRLDETAERVDRAMDRLLQWRGERIRQLRERLDRQSPAALLGAATERLQGQEQALLRAYRQLLGAAESRLALQAGKLQTLSPLAVLQRGYGIATAADGRTLDSIGRAAVGDDIHLRLADGVLAATVTSVTPHSGDGGAENRGSRKGTRRDG